MAVQLAPAPVFQGLGFGGLPLPGGKLFSYQAGTNTPQATFTDSTGIAQNTNPVILNANGQANVWLTVGLTYKLILQDQFGNQIWSVDNIPGGISLNLTQQALGLIIYPTVVGEVGVTNNIYPYGCPRRFGAVGDGLTNDTNAVQNAINSAVVTGMYWGWQGDNYSVSTVTWPASGPSVVHFNGSELTGNAIVPTTCISQIKSNFTTFYDYVVNGGGAAGVIPNTNYTCSTWWFNGHITSFPTGAATGASQFNSFYGMYHLNATRGLVYGQLPGSASSATIVHSENKIYGFQSVGVSNPIYVNSGSGFLHTYGSTYFRDASTWSVPTLPGTSRAVECIAGSLWINGGELIASNSLVGFAADIQSVRMENVFMELSASLNVVGSNNRFLNCDAQVNNQGVNMFVINASATGYMEHTACNWFRQAGTGATDRTPLMDGSAAPAFEVIMNNCLTEEWGFVMAGANVKLIQGCIATYKNHRLSITAADPNIYRLNSTPRVSIIPDLTLDHLGYTTTGWILNLSFGAGTTLTNSTIAGPPGYLASQLNLHATGVATAQTADPTSLATLKSTAQRVTPGESFWISSWVQLATGGGNVQLVAIFYNLSGSGVSTVVAADITSIGNNAWVFAEGPAVVPATASYVAFGLVGTVGGSPADVYITDFRIQRAS